MRIIVVGAGEIGRHLASSLSHKSHQVALIERDETIAMELDQQLDAKVIRGDGAAPSLLLETGVADCELFLALTSSSAVNVFASSIAKKLGAKKVIARIEPQLERDDWLVDYRSQFDLDDAFSPEWLSAIELAKHVRNPGAIAVEEIARGRIELQQLRVEPGSEAAGKSLLELKAPERTRVAIISRGGSTIIPSAGETLEPGDIVTIFGKPHALAGLSNRLQKEAAAQPNVVIFGGGEYGFCLAQMLSNWDCRVRIFEKDRRRADELADLLSRTTVINGDGTDLATLEEEQVGRADFFIATGRSDEDNVMTCLQAHNLGTETCLTLIHRADYATAISSSGRHFGMKAAVSPREATLRDIERHIAQDGFHTLKSLGSAAEVIEATLGDHARACGKRVSAVQWPPGCILVGLLRGARADVPAPTDELEAGDVIYAIIDPAVRRKFLKLIN